MSELVTEALMQSIKALSEEAGRAIMDVYATDFSVKQKEDFSPLTEADMAAHHAIAAGLAALTPEIPVLSEESADTITWEQRREWPSFWMVDPLDGTKEFVKRNGEFTVNIALIEGHDAVLGAVHVPAKGQTYIAARGLGAHKSAGGALAPISVTSPAAKPLRVAGSRSHGNEQTQRFVERMGDTEMVAIGSALKLCLVAEGAVDIYPRFGPTSEWDTAAAQCVVEQAGGRVTETNLEPLRYNAKESILNPFFLVFGDTAVNWAQYNDAP
jgi:3'(2'), 5'-bisphosphate nucleotidase